MQKKDEGFFCKLKDDRWQDILVCEMRCDLVHRCKQFPPWRKENEAFLWQKILAQLQKFPTALYYLHIFPKAQKEAQVKQYACLREGRIVLLTEEEIKQHLLRGEMFEQIFEIGREMEIQIKLVPSSKKPIVSEEEAIAAPEPSASAELALAANRKRKAPLPS